MDIKEIINKLHNKIPHKLLFNLIILSFNKVKTIQFNPNMINNNELNIIKKHFNYFNDCNHIILLYTDKNKNEIQDLINKNKHKLQCQKDNVLVKNHRKLKYFFPKHKNLDKVLITTEGLYSVTYPKHAEMMSKLIISHLNKNPKTLTITDATANVGGNTINFSKHFKTVNAIEYSDINYDALKNNINIYNLKNVNLKHNDYTKIINNLKQDVVFMDPPWGGPYYIFEKKIKLHLSNIFIEDIIPQINADLIALKVPLNLDLNAIISTSQFDKIFFYKIRNYGFIILKN